MESCLEIAFITAIYQKDNLNGYVILGFTLSFLVSAVLVVLLTKYIFQQLNKEKDRLRHVEQLKRDGTYKRAFSGNNDCDDHEDSDSDSNSPLGTNYMYISPQERTLNLKPGLQYDNKMYHELNPVQAQRKDGDEVAANDLNSGFDQLPFSQTKYEIFQERLLTEQTLQLKQSSNILGLYNPNDTHFYIDEEVTLRRCRPSFVDMSILFSRFQDTKHAGIRSILGFLLSYCSEAKLITESTRLSLLSQCEQRLCENKAGCDISTTRFTALRDIVRSINNRVQSCENQKDEDQTTCLIKTTVSCIGILMIKLTELFTDYFRNSLAVITNEEIKLLEYIIERWKTAELLRARIEYVSFHSEQLLQKKLIQKVDVDTRLQVYWSKLSASFQEMIPQLETRIQELVFISNSRQIELCQSLAIHLQSLRADEFKNINTKDSIDVVLSKYTETYTELVKNQLDMETKEADNFNILQFKNIKKLEVSNRKEINELLKNVEDDFFTSLSEELEISPSEISDCGKAITSSLKEHKATLDTQKQAFIQKAEEGLSSFYKSLRSFLTLLSNKSKNNYMMQTYISERVMRVMALKYKGSKERLRPQNFSRLLLTVMFSDNHLQYLCYATTALTNIAGKEAMELFSSSKAFGLGEICDKIKSGIGSIFKIPEAWNVEQYSITMLAKMKELLKIQEGVQEQLSDRHSSTFLELMSPSFCRNRLKVCKKLESIAKMATELSEGDSRSRPGSNSRKNSLMKPSRNDGSRSPMTLQDLVDLYISQHRMYKHKMEEEIKLSLERKQKKMEYDNYLRLLENLSVCDFLKIEDKTEVSTSQEVTKLKKRQQSKVSISEADAGNVVGLEETKKTLISELKATLNMGSFVDEHIITSRVSFSIYDTFMVDKFLEKVSENIQGETADKNISLSRERSMSTLKSRKGNNAESQGEGTCKKVSTKDNEQSASSSRRKSSILKTLKNQNKNVESTDKVREVPLKRQLSNRTKSQRSLKGNSMK